MTPVTIDPFYVPPAEVEEEVGILSVSQLGDYLGRDLSSDDGALIAVESARDICRDVAEQTFTQVLGETIFMDGTGTDALLLPEFPVSAVEAVKDEGEAVTDWVLNDNGVLIRKTDNGNPSIWETGRQRWTVTYDHGYADADLPRSVRRVALEIAARMVVQGVASFEVSGSQQIRYGTNSTDLSAGEKAILRLHKRSR